MKKNTENTSMEEWDSITIGDVYCNSLGSKSIVWDKDFSQCIVTGNNLITIDFIKFNWINYCIANLKLKLYNLIHRLS